MSENNLDKEIAIQITGLKKRYKLGQIGGGTLQGDLQSWWAQLRGKEDPNSVIGQNQRLSNQVLLALNGINLTIFKGEAIGIVGANGAGKSTLLKILSRVTAPTEGEIIINGRIISMLEVGTGFSGEMTGRENIYMNGAILGMSKAEIDAKLEDIIDFSEVRDFIDTPVKRYSSGMYVKLAFAVAAHLDAEIMIMDEVLAVGDLAFQKKCLKRMRDAAEKEGRTILYVSHNMNTIKQLCTRCIVMNEGRIVYDGDTDKGIEIYVGNNISLLKRTQLLDRFHSNSKTIKGFRMKEIELINQEKPVFQPGNIAIWQLLIDSDKRWDNVRFRLEISYQDGMKVGTMLSKGSVTIEPNGVQIVKIQMSTDHLPPGRYQSDIIAYISNDMGQEQFLDGVYPGIGFEIEEIISEINPLIWLHKYWGYVHLDDVVVHNVE